MQLNDILYQAPEMSDEKLLSIIEENLIFMRNSTKKVIEAINYSQSISKNILDEWEVIQRKESKLSRSQRDEIKGFVAACLIKMTKDEGDK